jgi:hypothetical protein
MPRKTKPKSDIPASAQLLPMIFGFMTAQAISVAAKLGVADLLGKGAKGVDELAQATGVKARPLYRILRALAGAGIFSEEQRRPLSLNASS